VRHDIGCESIYFWGLCALYLHSPTAAAALMVVPGQVMHYRYAFFPVMVGSILLVIAEAVYSNLTGKHHPNMKN
jgi:CBS domain-containing membrane protein